MALSLFANNWQHPEISPLKLTVKEALELI
jgi:hypothetical protein